VRGDPDQVSQIKAVLLQLGEDGSGVRPPRQGGSRRRYSLQGRNPDEFLRILQDTWNNSERNPIRAIIPSRSGPIQERRTSNGAVDRSETNLQRKETGEKPQSNSSGTCAVADREYLSVGIRDENADDADVTLDDVLITVLGDDLLLASDDGVALDRLEELLDALQQTLPYRTRWTIFYLQAADAIEATEMLSQIFPGTSIASSPSAANGGSFMGALANSVSGIGSSLADATGLGGLGASPQTLRIIPDVRSNSLLIAGPDDVLQDVWAMLNVLDANDIPESFRDMRQRTLTVEYANIDNVAMILRDVYKPLMEDPNADRGQQRQRRQNSFSAMLGESGDGNNSSQPAVRMTLGVDRQTSSLIVSSSQSIFNDVRELVETLDKNAMAANRTIRVVQLRSVDPTLVQRSLTGLFPRVSTSVSVSRTTGNGGNSDARNSNPQGQRTAEDRQAADAVRRFQERATGARQGGVNNTQNGGARRANGQGNGGQGRRGGQQRGR
jgi:hypothetical protein